MLFYNLAWMDDNSQVPWPTLYLPNQIRDAVCPYKSLYNLFIYYAWSHRCEHPTAYNDDEHICFCKCSGSRKTHNEILFRDQTKQWFKKQWCRLFLGQQNIIHWMEFILRWNGIRFNSLATINFRPVSKSIHTLVSTFSCHLEQTLYF